MPKATYEEEAEWKLPGDTPLEAALVKVEERVFPFKNKRTGKEDSFTKWEWEFEILSGEYAGLHAWGRSEDRLTTHPDNQVRQWAEALRGKPFELGEGLDTDDLLGLTCVLTIENTSYERKDGTTAYVSKVSDVFPAGSVAADPWATSTEEPPF